MTEKNKKAAALNKKAALNKSLIKRKGGSRPIPKTAQQTLPWLECYEENGVFQISPGKFSRTFEFEDISFNTRSDDEQDNIYDSYMKFLNSLNPKEDIYLHFVNGKEDADLKLSKVTPVMRGDKYDKLRKELTTMLSNKMKTARNNIETRKLITCTIEEPSVDKAMKRIDSLSGELENNFHKVTNAPLNPLSLAERLELINNILNSDEGPNYYFKHDKNGKVSIDWDRANIQKLTTKDLISPEFLKFPMGATFFQINDRYGQSMYMSNIANWMNSNFLSDLTAVNFECVITLHIVPIPQADALRMVHNQSVNITAEVMQKQKGALENGYSTEFISADLRHAKDQVDQLQEDLMNRDQKMFYMSLTLTHFADTREQLKENTAVIREIGQKYMCQILPLTALQERGFTTSLPIGEDRTFGQRPITTESLGVFIPFNELSQFDDHGIYYGVNSINKSLIVYNRVSPKAMNYNGLVLGSSGSGKSFSAKREMSSAFLYTNADIFIIDPDGEYGPIAEAFDGSIIDIAPGNTTYINPMDLDIDNQGDKDFNPMTMKVDFICGLLESMLGQNIELNNKQRSLVDRCLNKVYRPYLERLAELPPDEHGRPITIDTEHCPTLVNLLDELMNQPVADAQDLALAMETYTTGSFSTFAHRTNVDVNNRFTVYNIKNIGTNLKEIALKVCLNDVWNRIVANKRKNKWTWMYVDEFHLLLSNASTSNFMKTIWKRARKFQGVPTGITQNVEDLLNSPDARTIINNTSFVYMLNQSAMDGSMLQNLLHLSDNDLKAFTNVSPGHGLIFTGKQAIPFMDEFPQDTELYKVMSTRPGEN